MPSPANPEQPSSRLVVALFVGSFAAVYLEVSLMKLAAVMFTPLFVYPILGVAMLGYGAAGSLLALRGAPGPREAPAMFARSLVLFAAVMLPAFLLVNAIDVPANELLGTAKRLPLLLLMYGLLTAPFVLAGLAISAVFSAYAKDVNRLYFADLFGAGLGSVLVVAALPWIGGIPLLATGAAIAAVAAMIALHDSGRPVTTGALVGGANVVALIVLLWVHPIPVHVAPDKHGPLLAARARPGGLPFDFTSWSTLGRVDITTPFDSLPPQMGGDVSPSMAQPIEQRMLVLDGAAPAFLFRVKDGPESLSFLAATSQSAVYSLRPDPNVLVIGVGGATDVLMALALGAKHVTAVELNPVNAHAVQHVFGDYVGNVLSDPRVQLVVAEGRNFAARDENRYDVVQLSGVDTGAALGAYGLGTMPESYVYTVEALDDFLARLTPNGILTITRDTMFGWAERLAAVARAALLARRLEPETRIAVLKGKMYGWATVLVKQEPFTPAEMDTLRAFSTRWDFPIVYDPLATSGEGGFYDVIRRGIDTHDDLDLRPSTDDWPFFFLSFRWDRLPSVLRAQASPLLNPIGFLAASLAGLTTVAAVLIGLPLWRLRRAWHGTTGRLAAVGYFAALGAGFMVAEVALMQRFTVFLGNPMLAVSVVLAALLIASGTGSWLARRAHVPTWLAVAWIVVMLVLVSSGAMRTWLEHSLGLDLPVRLAITIALVVLTGIPMGMPFPAGLARLAERAPQLVPWGWGINSMVSVLTSLASYFIGMIAGYTAMFYTGAVLYLAALLLARRL